MPGAGRRFADVGDTGDFTYSGKGRAEDLQLYSYRMKHALMKERQQAVVLVRASDDAGDLVGLPHRAGGVDATDLDARAIHRGRRLCPVVGQNPSQAPKLPWSALIMLRLMFSSARIRTLSWVDINTLGLQEVACIGKTRLDVLCSKVVVFLENVGYCSASA